VKSRLHWSFTQFLGQLAAQRPILLVLENLQWADSSSLELLHFVARQMGSERVALLCTYNETELDANPTLRATEQSLLSLGAGRLMRLEPLAADALQDLVRETFHADAASARALAGRLYSWTRGNPFFVEEVLKALVESGALHEQDGSWLGWEAELPGLPRSIRDAVTGAREPARRVGSHHREPRRGDRDAHVARCARRRERDDGERRPHGARRAARPERAVGRGAERRRHHVRVRAPARA
jgi:hypothetical protein